MAKINPALIDRLGKKLGVSKGRVYARIQETANSRYLPGRLAALALAAELGIGLSRYAMPEEIAQLGGRMNGSSGGSTTAPPAAASPRRQKNSGKPSAPRVPRDGSIFVVHGRNKKLTKDIFDFLRALGLDPLEWPKALLTANRANPNINDILDKTMNSVQAILVLFSPDDEARLRKKFRERGEATTEGKLQAQARANVIFEAGLALGLRPKRTLLVQVGKVKGFSDIAGMHMMRLSNAIEKRNDLANRLRLMGCKVDTTGDHWTSTGDFRA